MRENFFSYLSLTVLQLLFSVEGLHGLFSSCKYKCTLYLNQCLLTHVLCLVLSGVLGHIGRKTCENLNEVTSCVENAKYSRYTKELNITMGWLKIARWKTKQTAQTNLRLGVHVQQLLKLKLWFASNR